MSGSPQLRSARALLRQHLASLVCVLALLFLLLVFGLDAGVAPQEPLMPAAPGLSDRWSAIQPRSAAEPRELAGWLAGTGEWRLHAIETSTGGGTVGLTDRRVIDIKVAPRGTVWVVTPGALVSLDTNRWTVLDDLSRGILRARRFGGFAAGPDGVLWLSSASWAGLRPNTTVARFDGEKWTIFGRSSSLQRTRLSGPAQPGSPSSNMPNRLEAVLGAKLVSNCCAAACDMPRLLAGALAVDSGGHLWAATGLGILHFDGETWTVFEESAWVIQSEPIALALGPDDSVWLAGAAGFAQYDGSAWHSFPHAGIFCGSSSALAIDARGVLWGLTPQRQLFWFDGLRAGSPTIVQEMPVGDIGALATGPDGSLWVVSSTGLTRYDGRYWTHYRFDEPYLPAGGGSDPQNISALAVGPDGTVWCGGAWPGVLSFRPDV